MASDPGRSPRQAMTVLGEVPADDLGFVLPHEHLRIDNSLHHIPAEGIDPRGPIDAAMLGALRVRPHAVVSNLVLDEDDAVVEELGRFRDLGGTTIVELTPRGMGRDPAYLASLARRTGVSIIAGTGYYVARAHGSLVAGRSIDELAGEMLDDLRADEHAAGVIGEIGISAEPHPDELQVLAAALEAQRRSGAPIWIHQTTLSPMRALLGILERERADMGRVVLCHTDFDLRDLSLHREALGMGLMVEMDLFGFPAWNRRNFVHAPDDTLRVERLLELAADGYGEQLLISQDVCMKSQLARYGGFGYTHIGGNVRELFGVIGGSAALWEQITRHNPARLLGWR